MMHMSSKGKKLVGTPEFASLIVDFVGELRKKGQTENGARMAAISLIAWVASGHEIDSAPSEQQLEELAVFMNRHAPRIRVFAYSCLKEVFPQVVYENLN